MPAKGFTSITVRYEIYEKLKAIARPRNMTITQVIEELTSQYRPPTPPTPYLTDENGRPKEVVWEWPGPYVQVVTDPKVEFYRSTAWIRSKEYPERAGRPQWAPEIMDRIRSKGEFTVEKALIVSPKAWNDVVVWEWISEWLSVQFAYPEKVQVFVVREEDARKKEIADKYFDMGIYGRQLVGFLGLKENSVPESYEWRFLPQEVIEEAIKQFEKTKTCAVDQMTITQKITSFEKPRQRT